MIKLITYIRQHPDITFIIGHLYQLELFLKEDKKYFKNTYFDLSNLYFVSKERTMMAYEHFGAEHLLLGSDTPYGKHALEDTIDQIEQLEIPEQEKKLIMGENLERIINREI